jgi:hypothetical protein
VGLVLGPNEGGATDWGILSVVVIKFVGFISVNESFVGEIVNLDSSLSSNHKPEELGGKEDNVNGGFSINFFKMSAFNKIPDVDFTVFATGSNEVGVWCKIQGVDLSLVSNESVLQSHDGVIPNFDGFVP